MILVSLLRHARTSREDPRVTDGPISHSLTATISETRGSKKAVRRVVTLLAGLGLALGLSISVGTTSANAWPWSWQVTLTGALNQCTNQGIQAAYVNAVFNNQRIAYETSAGQPPHYSVTFTNVPGNGGWAWIVVNCAVVGGSQGHWVHVYRPALGSTLGVNL